MENLKELLDNLLLEAEKLHKRHELSQTVGADYYEPGMMEFLDKSDGLYDEASGSLVLRFESMGTRYEGRTELIESVKINDEINVVRDENNRYNPNNFVLLTGNGKNVGNMPAGLCNAIAPLFDNGYIVFDKAFVSYVEPISTRSRHAQKAILFVELDCRIIC